MICLLEVLFEQMHLLWPKPDRPEQQAAIPPSYVAYCQNCERNVYRTASFRCDVCGSDAVLPLEPQRRLA
jgi:hypothetical protein